MDKNAFLVKTGDTMKIINTLEEFADLTFNSVEEANSAKVFEIEFKRKINFETKVKIELEKS